MGNCLKSKEKKNDSPDLTNHEAVENPLPETKEIKGKAPKSWETRPKLNKEDYQFKNRENEFLLKKPGQIKGQGFIVEKCKNCKIFLCDYIDTILVDDCENCQIFIGPCSSSAFVRTSSNLSIIVACQQYRISESLNINSLLFCMTQPTLEKCSNLKFGCFNFGYFNLREQFDKAGLNIWNNSWFEVFDFSKGDNKNFGFLPKGTDPNQLLDFLKNEEMGEMGVVSNKEDLEKNCLVPLTIGNLKKSEDEEVLCFIHPEKTTFIEQSIQQMNILEGVELVRTKAIKLNKIHLEQLFTNKTNINYEDVINSKKEAIFLLFAGKKCSKACDLMSQTCLPGFFHVWDKKDDIKKCSSLIFDSWKHENSILK